MFSYHISQKIIHWSMSLIIISMLIGGFFMEDAPKDLKPTIYMVHKSLGFLILMLLPLRIILRGVFPPKPDHIILNKAHKILIKLSIPLLYLGMFLMSFSGFMFATASGKGIHFFNMFDVPLIFAPSQPVRDFFVSVHEFAAPLMVVLVMAHFLASLYHHFYLKDNTLKSMM